MNLVEKDEKFIWHPFTHQKNMDLPVPITHGKGALLFDENGKEYIDAISSWWVNIHGHAHPYIAKKIYEQAKTLEHVIFAGFTHKPAVELAERLLPLLPGNFDKIFYSDNGSTSTEVAIKMALQYWWNKKDINYQTQKADDKARIPKQATRNKIVAFNNSYHGDTFGAMSVSDRSVFTLAFQDKLFEVIFIDIPTHENIEQLSTIIHQSSTEIAAFIYEPLVQGAGGMKMFEPNLLNKLLTLCKKHEIICIADEVMTGFGRTGKLFASEYCEEKPDIICLSKGLTGGTMALGVTACTKKIYEAFISDDKLKTFFHGHSFTANPIACIAAIASLDLFKTENSFEKISWICEENKKFSELLISRYSSSIRNIRCLGTIIAFEIDQGKNEYLNNNSTIITQKSMKKGVYIRPLGNTVYIMPPYCITRKQLNTVQQTIIDILF
ncbi:MAG TPA: adenosylmethionine--8-amino-7-oxononanoate transaminase [Chitinophagaceae bacterium]|nr:adenosylmethionine--8-amino-7-oxononanoate transaminase [Chitinophagaceae bacterium]